jgi:hypothetical protein
MNNENFVNTVNARVFASWVVVVADSVFYMADESTIANCVEETASANLLKRSASLWYLLYQRRPAGSVIMGRRAESAKIVGEDRIFANTGRIGQDVETVPEKHLVLTV